MVVCNCISLKYGSINTLLTYSSGILITHLHVLVIRKYKLQESSFPKVIYYIVLYALTISILLWLVNIFINYYTYKEYYYLKDSDFDSLTAFGKSSFDSLIAFLRVGSMWVLIYFLYHMGRRSNIAEKEKAELNQLLAESSLNHLKEQINPHFMFNALNSIKALIKEDPQKARKAIVILADNLRSSLNNSSRHTVPLQKEIDHCRDYLKMEKIRFEDRLQYQISVDNNLMDFLIPPLSIQTLVENAIKHGLNKSIHSVDISINCREEVSYIITTVINNGTLTANKNGTGIKNLMKRFEILYQDNFDFSVVQKDAKVIAEFKLPKNKSSDSN